MSDPFPAPLQAEPIPGGFRIRLPHRRPAPTRIPGIFALVSGLGSAGFAVWWFLHCLDWEPHEGRAFRVFGILLGCLGFSTLILGLPMLIWGLWMLLGGRGELEVTDRGIRIRERLSVFFWTRRIPRHRIGKITVEKDLFTPSSEPMGWLGVWILRKPKPAVLPAYPLSWLEAISRECSRLLGLELDPGPGKREPFPKPWSSPVTLVRKEGESVLQIPGGGFWSQALLPLVAGVLWTITSLVAFGRAEIPAGSRGWFTSVEVVFVGVGLGLVLGGLKSARRRAELTATSTRIRFVEQGAFRTRVREWPRTSLLGFGVAESFMRSNDEPVFEIRIRPAQGKDVKILRGRPREELEWMVHVLRETGTAAPDSSSAGTPTPTAS